MRRLLLVAIATLVLTANVAMAQQDLNEAIIQSQNPTNPRNPALPPLPVTPEPVVVPHPITPPIASSSSSITPAVGGRFWGVTGMGVASVEPKRHHRRLVHGPQKQTGGKAARSSRPRGTGDTSKDAAAENDKLLSQKLKSICRGC